jgi:hypothetical protein
VVVPWFRIRMDDVDQGHAWLATNEEEVFQNFVRLNGGDLEKRARNSGLDLAGIDAKFRIVKVHR